MINLTSKEKILFFNSAFIILCCIVLTIVGAARSSIALFGISSLLVSITLLVNFFSIYINELRIKTDLENLAKKTNEIDNFLTTMDDSFEIESPIEATSDDEWETNAE